MSDVIQKLKSLGAQSVAGSLILDRKEVAILRHGQVILTPDGEEALKRVPAMTQPAVPSETEAAAPAPAARPARVKRENKAADAPAPASSPAAPADLGTDIGNLLAGDE